MNEPKLLNRWTGSILLVFFLGGIIAILGGYVKDDIGARTVGFVIAFGSGCIVALFVINDVIMDRIKDREDEL